MTAGLRIINGDNKLLLDEEYDNYELARKFNVSAETGNPEYVTITRTYEGTSKAIFAFRTRWAYAMLFSSEFSNGEWTIKFLWRNNSGNDDTLIIYVFDVGVDNSNNFGLRVRNSSGSIIFQSGNKPLRMMNSFNDSKTQALIVSNPSGDLDYADDPPRQLVYIEGYRITPSGRQDLTRLYRIYYSYIRFTKVSFSKSIFWCDVTNY